MWSRLADARRSGPVAAVAAAVLVLAACGDAGGATTAVPDSVADGEPATHPAEPSVKPTSEPGEPTADSTSGSAETSGGEPAGEDGTDAEDAPGSYRDYSQDLVADPAYDTTILFFHASWCPECRAFDESIRSGSIPGGVQILKVDYDSETDLKQRYGVTIQSTFVKVGPDGEEISSWVGYGKDRSIDTILGELG